MSDRSGSWHHDPAEQKLEIRSLRADERCRAAQLVAHAMRDNPLEVAALGNDARRRERALERMFRVLLRYAPVAPLVACRTGRIIGLAGGSPPGSCPLPTTALVRLLPALAASGPRACARRLRCLAAWGERDLLEPHWHVGPVAVDVPLRGRGVGSRLLERLCARVDAQGAVAYLETDRPENTRFYGRFGFETVDEAEVIGVRSWFMRRPAGRGECRRATAEAGNP